MQLLLAAATLLLVLLLPATAAVAVDEAHRPPVHVLNLTTSIAARRVLYDQPNNYGDNAHAKIRVQNGCAYAVEVAIVFFFNTWGECNGAKHRPAVLLRDANAFYSCISLVRLRF